MRVAILATHPIQYYAPWFRHLAACADLIIRVFYLWNDREKPHQDLGFGQIIEWDIPLFEGYDYEFVANVSHEPRSDRFWGINNPQLLSRLREFRPDAALLIGYNFASFAKLLFLSEKRRAFPLMMRGDSHRLLKTRKSSESLRRMAIASIFKRFSSLLYVGRSNYEYFRAHGVPEQKLYFSPHAIDNDRFTEQTEKSKQQAVEWRRSLGIPKDNLVILFAGKFEEKKRPMDLLEAFCGLDSASASLLFVGSGPLEKDLRARAANVSNVYFAPFQNQTLMPRTYAAGDVFVLPSGGSKETWGLAINEALCLSRPVIVSDHVGCAADLVRHKVNGLVFNAGDVNGLTAAMGEALSQPDRLKKWGEAGRQIVNGYTFEAASRGLLEAVHSLRHSHPHR